MELAPVVLFVYNRPSYTEATLESLSKNVLADQTLLYIYADGPKNSGDDAMVKISQVREVIRKKKWCKEVVIVESDTNRGLANSVILGVSEIVGRHGKVIVLEDDILTSKYFLKFLNDGLTVYANDGNVYAINSYMFPIETSSVDTFLSPLATSTWGWATWASKWNAFEIEPKYKSTIQSNQFIRSRFNFADYNYAAMLDNTNSWGIRWYYSVFMRNGLGLFPTKSLSRNIGFGEDATHTGEEFSQMKIYELEIEVKRYSQIEFNLHGLLLNYFSNTDTKRVVKRGRLSAFLRKLIK